MVFRYKYFLIVSLSFVEINRSAFAEPEAPLLPKKSPLISHKCNVSVGQVVNGATLPTIPLHTPVCSFDAQNRYTGFTNSTEIVVKSGPEPTG